MENYVHFELGNLHSKICLEIYYTSFLYVQLFSV